MAAGYARAETITAYLAPFVPFLMGYEAGTRFEADELDAARAMWRLLGPAPEAHTTPGALLAQVRVRLRRDERLAAALAALLPEAGGAESVGDVRGNVFFGSVRNRGRIAGRDINDRGGSDRT